MSKNDSLNGTTTPVQAVPNHRYYQPTSDWYNVFQSELIAEACLERIVHKAMKFALSGESLRKKY